MAEDLLRLLPQGTHDPDLFIRPSELRRGLTKAGLVPGHMKGLAPRGGNTRGDFTFGPFPSRLVIYMGIARKPKGPTCSTSHS